MSHPPFPPSPLSCTHNGLYPSIPVTLLNLRIISLRRIHLIALVDNMLPLLYKSRAKNSKRETVTFDIQYYDRGWGSLFWVQHYVSVCADICALVYALCWNNSLNFLISEAWTDTYAALLVSVPPRQAGSSYLPCRVEGSVSNIHGCEAIKIWCNYRGMINARTQTSPKH